MKTDTELHEWIAQVLDRARPEIVQDSSKRLHAIREDAQRKLMQMQVPSRKSEAWRYTWLDSLFQNTFVPVSEQFAALDPDDISDWLLPDTDAYRIVFANGRHVPELTSFNYLPDGVSIGSLQAALTRNPEVLSIWFRHAATHNQDVFSELNTALMSDGLFVHLSRDARLDRPVEVIHLNLAVENPALIQPSNLLVLDKGADARIVEHYISTGDSTYFHNGITEIALEEHARLEHIILQNESRNGFHLHRRFLTQADNSHYNHINVSNGARWVRQELQADLSARQAICRTQGIYLTGDNQLCDYHLNVQHNMPGNTSEHTYKGIVYGSGRAVFDGRVLIAKQAQQSRAWLANHSMLLSRRAEVDTKPQLEIYADDVECGHGATVGSLDPQQLFYLRSRGINEQTAVSLLCNGFIQEPLMHISHAGIRAGIQNQLASLLAQVATKGLGHE